LVPELLGKVLRAEVARVQARHPHGVQAAAAGLVLSVVTGPVPPLALVELVYHRQ
jgi:hypothetical protein